MIKPKETKPCQICGAVFKPFKTTDSCCSYDCMIIYQNDRKSSKPTPRKPIPVMSVKRKKENAIYLKDRIDFLNKPENKMCRVFPKLNATEVHHMKGRTGKLFLDQNFWLAVSRKGHQKIEMNPDWAKENGFSLNRL